eukprot:TRINITY_DN10485_c1_g3_i1.p1 TRINITY_DN10485_c1_g3~~TRINITY_DN10485_c1_g3_i1.p1  ORF type:complete len:499 (-),score=73.31 TRINITY_DN10485_c1_g3_i1:287-1690(-)
MAKKRKLEPKAEPELTNGEEEIEEEKEPKIEPDLTFDDDDDEEEEDATEDQEDTENINNVPDPSNASPESDGDDEDEDIQKLLEPLAKDQLIDLLRDAATNHPEILDRVRTIAEVDPVHRKIFVHGLGWDTDAEALREAFKEYGEIEDCNAVRDKFSGKSKGYGFILFKRRSGARNALKQPQKKIGNRMTACQLASAGPPAPPPPPPTPAVSEYTQRKIYVSNVSADIDPQKLLQYFAKYGEVEEGPLGLDKQTGKPKGFSLFVYKSVDSARKALEEPHKNFEGHMLHCQKAIDGPKPMKPHFNQHHAHHTPGGGRGSHFPRNESPNFGQAGPGHMMAPSPGAMSGFNQAAPAVAGINPALGQALTALLAGQGAGFGLTNLLGSLGSAAPVNPTVQTQMGNNAVHGMQGGYGNPAVGNSMGQNVMGGYGNAPAMQGGYANPQMGPGNSGRSQQGVGHMGGVPPYMGH